MSIAASSITAASITTAEQLLSAGDIGRCELVRGQLIMMSPAGANHGYIAVNVCRLIANHVVEHGVGRVFAAETGFFIGRNPDTVRAPDVAFVRKERATVPKRGFFPGAPDLAVEVLSPDDSASEVLEKVEDWLAAGTESVWIVDPQRQTIAVHRASSPAQVFHADDEVTDEAVLPGFRMRVADVFA
jgi:Uma2 family endonuclease